MFRCRRRRQPAHRQQDASCSVSIASVLCVVQKTSLSSGVPISKEAWRCISCSSQKTKEPATFIRSSVTEKGARASWQCACGFKFGDTRAVAVKKAAMTAFKSSSVMLCGHRFTGRKSKWPSIYNQPPFNAIEVRTRDTFFGPTPASSSAS